MSQIPIATGGFTCDTTGTRARIAFNDCNLMFAELFGLAALGTPQLINIGQYQPGTNPLDLSNPAIVAGESSSTAFPKINANFAALFAFLGSALQQVILMGGEVGMIIGTGQIIGTGDPARVAWTKVNNNFTYLYTLI